MIRIVGPVLVVLILAGVTIVLAKMYKPKTEHPPELAQAARLLDNVRAFDDTIASLPTVLKDEIVEFTDKYYEGIGLPSSHRKGLNR